MIHNCVTRLLARRGWFFTPFECLQRRAHDLDPEQEHHDHYDAVHHHLEGKGSNFRSHDICSCFRTRVLISLVCPHGGISSNVAETGATIVVFCILQILPGLRTILLCFLILISWTIVDEQLLVAFGQTFIVKGPRCESRLIEHLEFFSAATI